MATQIIITFWPIIDTYILLRKFTPNAIEHFIEGHGNIFSIGGREDDKLLQIAVDLHTEAKYPTEVPSF